MAIANEYLRKAASRRFGERVWRESGKAEKGRRSPYSSRDELVRRYAWAIPNEAALRTIAKYGPLVEVGAGTGYWASLLRARGVDILAFDENPPHQEQHGNGYFEGYFTGELPAPEWTKVEPMDAEMAASLYPQRTLLLCWPPYGEEMATKALFQHFVSGGEHVIYIGEGSGGCTGNDEFHDMLDERYDEIERVSIPQWDGMYDRLYVYRRKV